MITKEISEKLDKVFTPLDLLLHAALLETKSFEGLASMVFIIVARMGIKLGVNKEDLIEGFTHVCKETYRLERDEK